MSPEFYRVDGRSVPDNLFGGTEMGRGTPSRSFLVWLNFAEDSGFNHRRADAR